MPTDSQPLTKLTRRQANAAGVALTAFAVLLLATTVRLGK